MVAHADDYGIKLFRRLLVMSRRAVARDVS